MSIKHMWPCRKGVVLYLRERSHAVVGNDMRSAITESLTDIRYVKGIRNGWPYIVADYQRSAGPFLGRRPRTSRRRMQGRNQGTTLSASDLHNARTNLLNFFYNTKNKIFKIIIQDKTWIEVDIPCINLTPNRYNALAQLLSTSAMTWHSH